MVDLKPFQKELTQIIKGNDTYCPDPRAAFHQLLLAQGFDCKAVTIGKLERIDGPECKNNQKAAWYIYREVAASESDGAVIGIANYGCWKTDINEKWVSRSEHRMDTRERMAYFAAREEMAKQIEQETKAKQLEAAALAYSTWEKLPQATNQNGYIIKKGVKAFVGVKQMPDGRLLIPVCDGDKIISTQTIMEDSTKRFLSGGRTKGGYFVIEGDASKVYVAEGYATAASIHEATGARAYVAFSSGNLYETALKAIDENQGAAVVICGDNGNGSKSANQAAETLQLEALFPPDPDLSDFNDYHKAHGLENLQKFFGKVDRQVYKKKQDHFGQELQPCAGFIRDVYNYYNATSGNIQYGFAIQTALAIAGVILGRSYKTDYENYSHLYLLNVGKTATGKEHPKTVIERVMGAANLGHLIGGDGYTSSGAVFTMLMHRPRHIAVIDEFGRYLEAGRDMKNGNHNQREANTAIMEAFGRASGVMRPKTYSAMTQKKEVAQEMMNRSIHNPSLTIMAMTTPETLYKTLSMDAVKDGFINRFLICQSDAERAIRKHKPPLEVPIKIIDWIERIIIRHGGDHLYNEPPTMIVLPFTQGAVEAQEVFQQFCIDKMGELDRFGMSGITGRSNEIAMKISLIVALSENPEADEVEERHMQWAIEYVKHYLLQTIDALKNCISGSDHEGQKKEVLAAIREAEEEGVLWSHMMKNSPYSKHSRKTLDDILRSLVDADLIVEEHFVSPKGGRPTKKFTAIR